MNNEDKVERQSYDKRVLGVKVASSCLMLSLSPPHVSPPPRSLLL